MTHITHDLYEVGQRWTCRVCGRTFAPTACVEDVLQTECPGGLILKTMTVGDMTYDFVAPTGRWAYWKKRALPETNADVKGTRLIDSWIDERGEK